MLLLCFLLLVLVAFDKLSSGLLSLLLVLFVFLFLFLLLSTSPNDFMIFVTRMASKSRPGHKYHEITWAYRVGC